MNGTRSVMTRLARRKESLSRPDDTLALSFFNLSLRNELLLSSRSMNGRADSPNHWMDAESIIFLLVIDDWLKEIFASRMESWEEGLGRLRTRSSPVMMDSEKAKLLKLICSRRREQSAETTAVLV